MRKVLYAMIVSLDGYIETGEGDLSWTSPDLELHQHFNDLESNVDVMLYGRRLYENMAAYWPTADENPAAEEVEKAYARIWRSKEKIVFSTTLREVEWNARLFRGDIAQEVARLKALPGNYLSVGGADLASTFMKLDLIDEYRLYIVPVFVGSGKPMFPQLENWINVELVETHTFGSGVVLLRYQRVAGGMQGS